MKSRSETFHQRIERLAREFNYEASRTYTTKAQRLAYTKTVALHLPPLQYDLLRSEAHSRRMTIAGLARLWLLHEVTEYQVHEKQLAATFEPEAPRSVARPYTGETAFGGELD